MRRTLLLGCLLAGLLQPGLARNATAARAQLAPRFLSISEGRSALTEGAEGTYFDSLQLGELRAKSQLALNGLSLTEARAQVRAKVASDVRAFTPEEQAMLAGVLERLAPKISRQFPLMARIPFLFVKAGTSVEAGIPHTRGLAIVLAPTELDSMLNMYRLGWTTILDQMAAPLLVHEQVHVLQRLYPERFHPLYTDLLGFRHLDSAPDHPWLAERRVVNPDAPDLRWVRKIGEGDQQRWLRTDLILRRLDRPNLADDTRTVGIDLIESAGGFKVALDANGVPRHRELGTIKEFKGLFPSAANSYHPAEISADLIAGWVTGFPEGNAKHPLRAKIGPWVMQHLN